MYSKTIKSNYRTLSRLQKKKLRMYPLRGLIQKSNCLGERSSEIGPSLSKKLLRKKIHLLQLGQHKNRLLKDLRKWKKLMQRVRRPKRKTQIIKRLPKSSLIKRRKKR